MFFTLDSIISTVMDYSPYLHTNICGKPLMVREFHHKLKVVYFCVRAHVIYL